MLKVIFIALFFAALPVKSFAIQTVTLTEGASPAVEISNKDLNLIKFPFSGTKVYTNSESVDIKIHGSDVFVNVLGDVVIDPINLFLATPYGTFSMLLIPKFIPSETIIVQVEKQSIEEASEWERGHDYITGIKEFIKAMYKGVPPSGVRVSKADTFARKWKEVLLELKSVFLGASLKGEIYDVVNVSGSPIRIAEREFYEEGVLAVSIDKHELAPSEKTNIYIVKKSQTGRKLKEDAEENNPFQALRYKN